MEAEAPMWGTLRRPFQLSKLSSLKVPPSLLPLPLLRSLTPAVRAGPRYETQGRGPHRRAPSLHPTSLVASCKVGAPHQVLPYLAAAAPTMCPTPPTEDSAHGAQAAAVAIKQREAAAALTAGACGPAPTEPPLQPGSAEYALHLPVEETHPHDVGTKDEWVPR